MFFIHHLLHIHCMKIKCFWNDINMTICHIPLSVNNRSLPMQEKNTFIPNNMLPSTFSLDVFCDCYQTPVLLSCKPSGRDPTPRDAVALTGCEGRASLRLQHCWGPQRQAGGTQGQGRRARSSAGQTTPNRPISKQTWYHWRDGLFDDRLLHLLSWNDSFHDWVTTLNDDLSLLMTQEKTLIEPLLFD